MAIELIRPVGRLRRFVRVAVSVAAGVLGALLVYGIVTSRGVAFYILAGAVVGLTVALGIDVYARAFRVAQVTLSVPQFSEITFVVTDDSRHVAWKLFVEVSTRIAVQPLDGRSGILREALTSLHSLFQVTRETLESSQPSRPGEGLPVEYLAIMMLNREIRPFLALWHAKLSQYERDRPQASELDWPENDECRRQLASLQVRLREYALNFARLADVQHSAALLGEPS
ncbi:hypothetical protein HC028_07025 [Planosporangium flavigriseum]|uniref:Uncharacterized protein n=1 Tax=Planosporangium flavigriseum TaxID=373681 RepID=A0A8J3M040_9ACTN|nr:hypothetical protein [Planosporangium flavigriseum]NJC64265.1 hypothetical protein [Planosporangium flavigriseum]GIG74250.1 hypothetical protein Pfl04_26540 [Planosporangium flavigriseum]